MANPKKILLNKELNRGFVKELPAASIIKPGMFLYIDTDEKFEIAANSVNLNQFPLYVALENWPGNKTVVTDWDDTDNSYAVDDTVIGYAFQSGDELYAWLDDVAANDVDFNDPLSIGVEAGTLVTFTPDATTIDGVTGANANEDVDNSGGSKPVRLKAVMR